MNDVNGTALAALAAALAPHIANELAKLNTGGIQTQQGGGFGVAQNNGANFPAATTGQFNPQGTQQQTQDTGVLQQGGAVQQNMFGANPNGQQNTGTAQPSVTPDMIQQLITPLVQNEQIKAVLTQQMQQMGITNLPDARPDQLPELYQRFQQVDQQARAAGLVGQQQQAGTPSII